MCKQDALATTRYSQEHVHEHIFKTKNTGLNAEFKTSLVSHDRCATTQHSFIFLRPHANLHMRIVNLVCFGKPSRHVFAVPQPKDAASESATSRSTEKHYHNKP